ncbi:hypothetical protein [Borrelia crocidurae]|uniref:Uncharacterized protein n=2 Tax=Borrelia crocidurae TaxID=29520 RepID=W5SKY8_9SPIR|nr:hypothetical protein [Borrelia crocidurae]AFI31853.1 hypothetical protein Q7M_1145 [Borrelia crocidurae str. Achema]AHH07318.1 Hypothetical protein BCD_1252 [Borrelia crocidurae DOU]
MKEVKEIKFPKRKNLKAEEMDIDDFIAQVDYTTMQLDREFREFQRQYGSDKSLDDWMVHMEQETQIQNQKIQETSETLSLRFAKRLNGVIDKD